MNNQHEQPQNWAIEKPVKEGNCIEKRFPFGSGRVAQQIVTKKRKKEKDKLSSPADGNKENKTRERSAAWNINKSGMGGIG